MKNLILTLLLLIGLTTTAQELKTIYTTEDGREVLIDKYSKDATDEEDSVIRMMMQKGVLVEFTDTANTPDGLVTEDVRAYMLEKNMISFVLFLVDAYGYEQEVILTRKHL